MNHRSILLGLSVLAVMGTALPVTAQEAFDWRRYEGSTINVALSKWVVNDLLATRLADFEALTGIKANVEVLPEVQNREKLTIAFSSGGKNIDVFSTQSTNEGLQYLTAGWYEPLDPYLDDPSMTPSEYGYPDDFLQTSLDAGVVNGTRIDIPIYASAVILAYRTDLLEAAGIAVPETFEELEEAARKLDDPANGQYGICMRGIGPGAAAIVGSFFHAMGGSWVDENHDPALTTPEVQKAVEYYVRVVTESGPPGLLNIDWLQCQNLFASGRVAMELDVNATMPPLLDETKSQVADKTGFALIPAGPGGARVPGFDSPGYAIYSGSENKGPAWYFILWATNAENNLNAQLNGVPTPRNSAWAAPEVQADTKFAGLRDATLKTLQLPRLSTYSPPFLAVPQIRAIFGAAMTEALSGGDIPAALQKAQDEIQEVRRKTGEIQ
jgi:multiple sugar transport system substrate-binding protein